MQFRNPAVAAALSEGRPIALNLGAGRLSEPGTFAVDWADLPGVDIVADLNQPLGLLPDDSVDRIYTSHTLEHIRDLLGLMRELHRVCRDGATLDVRLPHFSSPHFYSDPTHVRAFGLYSFHYFSAPEDQPGRKVPEYYSDARFRVEAASFHWERHGLLDRLLVPLLRKRVNRSFEALERYERRWVWIYPVAEMRFRLTVRKPRAAV